MKKDSVSVGVRQVWQDCDRRHKRPRLVQILQVGEHSFCRILTNGGGRPATSSATPELIGTGAVGELTRIRTDRFVPNSSGYRLVGWVSD